MFKRLPLVLLAAVLILPAACADDPVTDPGGNIDPIDPGRAPDPGLSFTLSCVTSLPVENPVWTTPAEIPPLTNPPFLTRTEQDFMFPDDLVFGVEISVLDQETQEQKIGVLAFPAKIMNYHEIVNFTFEGVRYHATWCPLAYSFILFRNDHWQTVKKASFQVSRGLIDNNLLMWDQETQSTWPQILAISNQGPQAGLCLEFERNGVATTWDVWRRLHPETLVLTNKAGGSIPPEIYETNPYDDWWAGRLEGPPNDIFRPDSRLPMQAIVFGIHGEGGSAAVFMTDDALGRVTVGSSPVVLFRHPAGETVFAFENNLEGKVRFFVPVDPDDRGFPQFKDEDGNVWNLEGIAVAGPLVGKRMAQIPTVRVYWFIWASFFPDTPLIRL